MTDRAEQFDTTIAALSRRWSGAGPLLPCFPLLAEGRPLSMGQAAEAAKVSTIEIEQALHKARCTFDHNGDLVDLFGMMLAPTYHRLQIGKRVIFSCCALWAHVIPKLIDQDVLVESIDPNSREIVRLSITPNGIRSVRPAGAMASMAIADPGAIVEDVYAAFCRHVRHLTSSRSAAAFAGESPSRRVIAMEELHELAMQLHEAVWASTRQGGQSLH